MKFHNRWTATVLSVTALDASQFSALAPRMAYADATTSANLSITHIAFRSILLWASVLMLLVSAMLPAAAQADTIAIGSCVTGQNFYGPSTGCSASAATLITNGSNPISNPVPVGAGAQTPDFFIWQDNNFLVTGSVVANNSSSGATAATTNDSLTVFVTVNDSGGLAGSVNLNVQQLFAAPAGFASNVFALPASSFLNGVCDHEGTLYGGNVVANLQIQGYAAAGFPGTLSSPCSETPFTLTGSATVPNSFTNVYIQQRYRIQFWGVSRTRTD